MRRFSSEEDFLASIDRHFPGSSPGLILGRGDDCAVLRPSQDLCLTTDLFLEHAHFRTSYFSPGDIGHKSLAVNLSDLAAMGAKPTGFCLSLLVPDKDGQGTEAAFWDEFFSAMARLAERHDVPLAGGDLSRASCLGVSITAWGEPGKGGRLLTRGPAGEGEAIFLAMGSAQALGLARVGLDVLEADGPDAGQRYPEAVAAHLRPEPLLAQGETLAAMDGVRTLMDVSDGLARDLPRLLGPIGGPERGARISLDPAGLHPELVLHAGEISHDPAVLAFLGGEDYVLLGTAEPGAMDGLRKAVPFLLPLGHVTREPGLVLNGRPFSAEGFDHFSP